MTIQGKEPNEVVSVYNPTLRAYQEISVEDLRIQLKSFGLTDNEISEKVNILKGGE